MIGRVNTGKPFIKGLDIGNNSTLCLCLPLEDYDSSQAARRLIRDVSLKKIDKLTITADKLKKPRSLDANALCWALCTQIAEAIGESKEEIYKIAVSEGNEYAPLWIKQEAVKDFCKTWESRGTGWPTTVVDTKDDMCLVFAYYGSSTYTSSAMSALIGRLMQDARQLGIEVVSERELSLLEGLK